MTATNTTSVPGSEDHTRADLELLDVHRFGNGVVHLPYRPLAHLTGSPVRLAGALP
jgi:hypothetical protein